MKLCILKKELVWQRIEADGLLARAFQHEVDHLNGILFIDHLEDYIRNEYRKELKKIKRMNKK